eukprot:SAG31_NODE_2109_length_6426_cov_13.928244_9_plen_58_part_00
MRLGARAGLRWRPPRAHLLAPPRCAARSCARGDGEAQLYLGAMSQIQNRDTEIPYDF